MIKETFITLKGIGVTDRMKCECGLKLKQLAPGVAYCDNHHLHIFAKELCEAHGYEPNERNIEMLTEVAKEMFNAKIQE